MERQNYRKLLKDFLHNHFVKTRANLGLTLEEMAEILHMDPRSYIDLDHGKNLCGTITFVFYLINLCNNPEQLIKDIANLFDEAEKDIL